jgi:bacterioferritin (cytochrome b1)
MSVLREKLKALFKFKAQGNGTSTTHDPVEILHLSYRDLLRLARQIDAHADQAPYPHVAQLLRRMASEKRQRAETLKEKILSLGGDTGDGDPEIRLGKNHWERINRDIEDQRLLESQFLERGSLLAEDAPEASSLLQQIVTAELSHKEILLDLLARADPQADQT